MSSSSPALEELEREGLLRRTFLRLEEGKRRAVLDAIITEMGERGPAEASIKSVAARAGVPVGSLYQYFPDRDAMVVAASALAAAGIVAEFEGAAEAAAGLGLEEGFEAYILGGLSWAETRPALLRVFLLAVYREGGGPAAAWSRRLVPPVAEAFLGFVRALVAAAAARGEVDPDLDPERAARLVNPLLVAVCDSRLMPGLDAYFRLYEGGQDPRAVAREAANLAARALAPRAPAPRLPAPPPAPRERAKTKKGAST